MIKSTEFQCLIELIEIVTRHKVKQIEVIGNPKSSHIPPSRYWVFFEQMSAGNFKNDRDAIAFFSLENNERSYKNLRVGLQNRLLNTLFFISESNDHVDEYDKIRSNLLKKHSALGILIARGAKTLSIKMAKDILHTAIKYQLTEIAYMAASELKAFYSMESKYQKKYEKYNELMWHYFDIRQVELKAMEYYERSIIPFISDKYQKKNASRQIQDYVKKMAHVPQKNQSEKFLRIYFLLRIYAQMTQYQWNKTVTIASEAISYYNEHPLFPKRVAGVFLQQRILAYFMLNEYQKASDDILLAEKYTPIHSKGWFNLKYLETLIYFHSSSYSKAWALIKEVRGHKLFQSLTEANKETWYIFDAYISFVQLLGKVTISPREKGALKSFRLSKFINEVPIFSRDKQGMNISILIIQVLHLLYEKKYNELEFKIAAIMKYKKRNLSDISLRTDHFLHIIHCLKRGNFQRNKVIHKATPYFEKLVKMEISHPSQTQEFEVIPYPILWDYIQELLSK